MEETKVIYYIDEEETPYLMKISQPPTKVSLADFKGQLNRSYQKFFFKSVDDDFGVVKEELIEDEALLPNVKGRVVCWVITGEQNNSDAVTKNDSESMRGGRGEDDISIISGTSRASSRRSGQRHHRHHNSSHHHRHGRSRHRQHGHNGNGSVISSSDMGSVTDITATDVDTASFCDTEDTLSRVSASTLTSLKPQRRKVLTKHKIPRSISCSTITTTTMTDASMQIVKVTLNMDTVNFLGISIVGHTNEDGSGGGIYVGSVMKGGAVAADGQIEPGDMLLEVNDVNFENMTNDDAVKTLRDIVQTPGPITLMVAKCWDSEPIVPSFEPRLEPIRPIDPSAWVMQTNQHHQGDYGNYQFGRPFTGSPTLTMTSNSSPSLNSSNPESEREPVKLALTTPMYRIAKSLANPSSGLEVKDRIWLKMTIPKSFIGTDLVEWLNTNVEGFIDRRHARKYAALMLKHNFIRHTVNKITFSEQCYYVFGDFKTAANSLPSEFQGLTLSDSGDGDTLGPLPAGGIWGSDGEFSVPSYDYYHSKSNTNTGSSGKSLSPDTHGHTGTGSSASSSGNSQSQPSGSSRHTHSPQQQQKQQLCNSNSNNGGINHQSKSRMRHSNSMSSSSEFTSVSQQVPSQLKQMPGSHLTVQNLQYHQSNSSRSGSDKELDRVSIQSTKQFKPSRRGLGVAAHLVQSRESFQQALDNPCQYFIM